MSLERMTSRYIASTEHVLGELEITENSINVNGKGVRKVVGYVKAYLEDAKYYRDKKEFGVSLASVAYCEGLLDALRLLGVVKFEWSQKRIRRDG